MGTEIKQKTIDSFHAVDDYAKHVDRLATLGQLAASVAHEIRNPLAGISTTAQVLRGKLDEDKREYIDVILGEIDRLDNIVRELLDFSRPNKGFAQKCNLHDVVEKSLVLVGAQFTKARIKIKKDFMSDKAPIVLADAEQLRQAFLNILLNAIAAMSKGGELIIKTEQLADERLKISFIDNGVGISNDKIADLFKPFFTTKTRGMGLGLAVTKKIVEQNNGLINVVSQENQGTCFYIEFPKENI